MVTAIVQLGIMFDRYLALADAVRVGSRAAAVSGGPAGEQTGAAAACAAVQASAPALHLACGTDVSVSASPAWATGGDVTVAASSDYRLTLFGLAAIDVPLQSSTTERIE